MASRGRLGHGLKPERVDARTPSTRNWMVAGRSDPKTRCFEGRNHPETVGGTGGRVVLPYGLLGPRQRINVAVSAAARWTHSNELPGQLGADWLWPVSPAPGACEADRLARVLLEQEEKRR